MGKRRQSDPNADIIFLVIKIVFVAFVGLSVFGILSGAAPGGHKFSFASIIGPIVILAIGLFLLVTLLLIGVVWFKRLQKGPSVDSAPADDNTASPGSYESTPLLSPAERSFFGVLQLVVGKDYLIFPKVRLADIVQPVTNPSRSGWQSAFNRICGKHVDFVLCHPTTLAVAGVIELDDKTHQRFERGIRDDLVDSALNDAGLRVVRVVARASYSPADIRTQLSELLPIANAPLDLDARYKPQ